MNTSRLDQLLAWWLADANGVPSDRVTEAVLEHVRSHPRRNGQRSAWTRLLAAVTAPRRVVLVVRPVMVLAAVALAAAIAGGAWLGANTVVPVLPSPSPSTAVTAVACPAGTNPDRPGPIDQDRPSPSATSGPLIVDWRARRLVLVTPEEVGHKSTLWTFDLCTNTWERREDGLTAGALAYDEGEDRIVIVSQASVTVYDLETDTYEVRGAPPLSTPDFGAIRSWRAVYDAVHNRVLVLDRSGPGVWSYDTASDDWEEHTVSGQLPPEGDNGVELVAYDRSVNRLIVYVRGGDQARTFELDLASRTWSEPAMSTPLVDFVYGDLGTEGIAYDLYSERTLVFSKGRVVAYDARAHAWETIYDGPPDQGPTNRVAAATTFDPVNRRLVVIGGWRGGTSAEDDVIAFDPRSLSWSTLLMQSEP